MTVTEDTFFINMYFINYIYLLYYFFISLFLIVYVPLNVLW